MPSRTNYDSGGLEILNAGECRALMGTAPIGRIVFTDQALPAIQPVNFIMHGDNVIIRTAEGSKLSAATRHTVVAFEVDHFDPDHRSGWSVVVIGPTQIIEDPEELAELGALPLSPWAPGHRDRFIRINPEIITGRRIP